VPNEAIGTTQNFCYNFTMQQQDTIAPSRFIGTFRRFGLVGPVYQVLAELPGVTKFMRVRVVETGEELDYPLTQIIDDPREG
jgi:hypothetical protein